MARGGLIMASGYTHARKVTLTDNTPDSLPKGYEWLKRYRQRTGSPLGCDEYSVRSDAGGMSTRVDWFPTLTEARKFARSICKRGQVSTWAEVFRWCENGQGIRSVFQCAYERELGVK